jgi:hypothetical protein
MLMQPFQLYLVSSVNKKFMSQLDKISDPTMLFLRYMDLWSGGELLVGLQSGCFATIPQDERGARFVLEGYRRYGGSARIVVEFAREAARARVAEENVEDLDDNNAFKEAIQWTVEKQSIGTEEAARAKALIYHNTSQKDGEGYSVHFASPYTAQKAIDFASMKGTSELAKVVAALGAESNMQYAYGVLYENEMHKLLAVGNSQTATATRLGCYQPNANKCKDRTAKDEVSLSFGGLGVLCFPGQSLENFVFDDKSELANAYILPITSNFPTHDSFVLMKASVFFDRTPGENSFHDDAWVLVGLQMTVSGSSEARDKPSHVVRGGDLRDHLKAIQGAVLAVDSSAKIIDIVTVFISPTESCRKMKFMDVTTKEGGPMSNAIPLFTGMAPQYYVVQEDTYVASALPK